MSKSRIGPFALEAPMSASKPTGQVLRALHLEQRKLAALRVFNVPMGMTPESRNAFAEQLEELKSLRHPHITRCFGGGFDSRKAYLAYELLDGESLDHVLERRGRLPWETALEYARQTVEALQYTHDREWIHGNLKPDKMVVTNAGVKICDWRRNEISAMLDSRQLDTQQILFSAPEILSGHPKTPKADLYSVGVLMYYMLTGSTPFIGEGQSLVASIQSHAAPDVSLMAMDCPVWLSAIVNQLLQKDPNQRPFSATALQLAFKEAERRQSEGVGVLQHATAGFSPLQLQADRDEAERVLGIKPEKKKKKNVEDEPTSFFDQIWVLALGLVGAIGLIVWFLLPPSETQLRQRAEKLLPPNTDDWMDWNDARDSYLTPIVTRFPTGEHTAWASEQLAWIEARDSERSLRREHRLNKTSKWTDAERQYWSATEYEEFGDLVTAHERFQALIHLYGDNPEASPIVFLAKEGLSRIEESVTEGSALVDFVNNMLDEAQEDYDRAKIDDARRKWEAIVTLYADSDQLVEQVALAQSELDRLDRR